MYPARRATCWRANMSRAFAPMPSKLLPLPEGGGDRNAILTISGAVETWRTNPGKGGRTASGSCCSGLVYPPGGGIPGGSRTGTGFSGGVGVSISGGGTMSGPGGRGSISGTTSGLGPGGVGGAGAGCCVVADKRMDGISTNSTMNPNMHANGKARTCFRRRASSAMLAR
jgi:hypothetical protein